MSKKVTLYLVLGDFKRPRLEGKGSLSELEGDALVLAVDQEVKVTVGPRHGEPAVDVREVRNSHAGQTPPPGGHHLPPDHRDRTARGEYKIVVFLSCVQSVSLSPFIKVFRL